MGKKNVNRCANYLSDVSLRAAEGGEVISRLAMGLLRLLPMPGKDNGLVIKKMA